MPSDEDALRSLRNGRCMVCGETFMGMTLSEYNSSVSRHIVDNHRDKTIDKPLVKPLEDADVE